MHTIQRRKRRLINTDPLRRCYDGCHFSSELVWGEWEDLAFDIPEENIEHKLSWWRDLNDYAAEERGETAKCEFRAVKQKEEL